MNCRQAHLLCQSDYVKVKVHPSPFLVNRAASISVSLAFGPHSCVSTMNATVGDWPSGSTVLLTPMLFPNMVNARQGNSIHHFQVFDLTRPGIEPRPPAYKASILPLGQVPQLRRSIGQNCAYWRLISG